MVLFVSLSSDNRLPDATLSVAREKAPNAVSRFKFYLLGTRERERDREMDLGSSSRGNKPIWDINGTAPKLYLAAGNVSSRNII
jgi:hypothetical protein